LLQRGKTLDEDKKLLLTILKNIKQNKGKLGILKKEHGNHLGDFAHMISNEFSKIETENLDLFFKEILLVKEA